MRTLTVYETDDGQIFKDRVTAESHDRNLRDNQVKNSLLTLIGDIAIVDRVMEQFNVTPRFNSF